VLHLRDPQGAEINAGCVIGGRGYIDGTVLPGDGRYSIVIDPEVRNVGTAQVKLIPVTDHNTSMSIGDERIVSIDQPGAVASLTFTGSAGQQFAVDVPSSTIPDQCGVLHLRDPQGAEINSGCVIGGRGSIATTALPVGGSYTVVVDPDSRNTGSATIRLVGK
jgi:hypothetical protein